MKKIIYPGSFDPFHKGHISLVNKALEVFDEVIIVVTKNINKKSTDTIKTRVEKIEEFYKENERVKVMENDNDLTALFAKKIDVHFLLRGFRNNQDFNYEYEMAKTNKFLNPDLETIFFFSEEEDINISSSFIKEIEIFKKGKK